MSSFLELCTSFSLRSGIVPQAPTTVLGQSGRKAQVVDWIAMAWKLIQASNPGWLFLKGEFSHALTINQLTYTSTQMGVATRFSSWLGDRMSADRLYQPTTLYDPAVGQSEEAPISEILFEAWRTSYDRGTHDANRPIEFCLAPDGTIRFGPKPDKAYVVRGEYLKTPQVLAADADIPDMPLRFHDIIVYRAIVLASEFDEAQEGLIAASREYQNMLFDLQREQLPEIVAMAEAPLA